MARSFASAVMSFGLVSIPVRICTAIRDQETHLRKICIHCNSGVEQPPRCPTCDRELAPEEIVRGFEITRGEYITLTSEEIEAVRPRQSPIFQLRAFVSESSVTSMLYFATFYYLEPGKGGDKAYGVLYEALRAERVLAKAYVVLREKPRMAFVKAWQGKLLLVIARSPAFLTPPDEVTGSSYRSSPKEMTMARELIRMNRERFSVPEFEVECAEGEKALRDLIEQKLNNQESVVATPKAPIPDLMTALESSLNLAKRKEEKEPVQ